MNEDLTPATERTFYFVGVTTGKSSIMRVFPAWAKHLGLDAVIRGIDCAWHDDPERYRAVVSFIKNDPLSLGALVTTHKIDLLDASRELFDGLGRHAELLGEVSSISKRDGELWGHAKDPVTSGLSLEAFLPEDHWRRSGGALCLLGAGGSSLALTTYCMEELPEGNRPSRIVVTNRSAPRLDAMRTVHEKINPGIAVEYHHCPEPGQNDAVVSGLPPGSVVANATGLGKDAPGSPLTSAARFPERGYAWDFNYRGDLLFIDQARAQQEERGLHVEDGWTYFIHGWTRVIAEVFHRDIPTSGPEFDELSRIAAEARR
ncbi:MAG: shikimate dehydrogenase family protein [Spirochaetota bacterium]